VTIIRRLDDLRHDPNSVVTVGTFDGVHLAHREIIREVLDRSRVREGRSVVVTFDPHPKEVVSSPKGNVELLSTIEERLRCFEDLGVDTVVVIGFTYAFSRLTAREFTTRYVVDAIGVVEIVVGYDHMFGRDREAGAEELLRIGKESGFSVFAMDPFVVDGVAVSSTVIRKALAAGDVEQANRLLGSGYELEGTVIAGDGRGRTFGFPTANIAVTSPRKVIPGNGVYLVAVSIEGVAFHGMMNIGVRPTVTDGTTRTLEVHVFDLHGDVYGRRIRVTFVTKLRDERTFASVQELLDQLRRDREQSLGYLARHHQQQ
jgi:riboflavin kinase/FMN adenylyltransferase